MITTRWAGLITTTITTIITITTRWAGLILEGIALPLVAAFGILGPQNLHDYDDYDNYDDYDDYNDYNDDDDYNDCGDEDDHVDNDDDNYDNDEKVGLEINGRWNGVESTPFHFVSGKFVVQFCYQTILCAHADVKRCNIWKCQKIVSFSTFTLLCGPTFN